MLTYPTGILAFFLIGPVVVYSFIHSADLPRSQLTWISHIVDTSPSPAQRAAPNAWRHVH